MSLRESVEGSERGGGGGEIILVYVSLTMYKGTASRHISWKFSRFDGPGISSRSPPPHRYHDKVYSDHPCHRGRGVFLPLPAAVNLQTLRIDLRIPSEG